MATVTINTVAVPLCRFVIVRTLKKACMMFVDVTLACSAALSAIFSIHCEQDLVFFHPPGSSKNASRRASLRMGKLRAGRNTNCDKQIGTLATNRHSSSSSSSRRIFIDVITTSSGSSGKYKPSIQHIITERSSVGNYRRMGIFNVFRMIILRFLRRVSDGMFASLISTGQ